MEAKKLKIASFFAGVGGIELGFKEAGFSEPVYANEYDKNAIKTYEKNFMCKVDDRNICDVLPSDIKDNIDIIMGGFPCQAFSIAGYRKGFEDTRGTMFFEMMRFIKEKKPSIVFAENVKNLVTHDKGNTFRVILNELKDEQYYIKYKIMNAMEYGNTPQNRERIYIVAFKDKSVYDAFRFPEKIERFRTLKDIIDFENDKDDKYYYYEGKYKGNIYQKLNEAMDDSEAIYQWRRKYVRKNQSNVVPTLTANQGEGGHNVCLIRTKDGRIRKMTPKECFNAQGFPEEFILPEIADSKLYKQAGNSVCVEVIKRIAEQLKIAVENNKYLVNDQIYNEN
ncbi:DNA (cytosine-5-)-methyltransferase [Traorella massiliensis]|uniref:DNA (cytosine-5-)-methyltransferase n=1 Tax=Traorella massiliensis TaxID=1903263 RepID=UPI002355E3D7|nr:DNA (cytosine-5-)-methyltransferase [Traorella massiliensis]